MTKVGIEPGTDKDWAAERWTEMVRIQLTGIGEHLLPVSRRSEQVYGNDWGPEVIELTNVAVQ